MSAQSWSVATTLGFNKPFRQSTLKGFLSRQTLSGLMHFFLIAYPRLLLRPNLGLKLANAFGVIVFVSNPSALFSDRTQVARGYRLRAESQVTLCALKI